jgi:hypothetical protein
VFISKVRSLGAYPIWAVLLSGRSRAPPSGQLRRRPSPGRAHGVSGRKLRRRGHLGDMSMHQRYQARHRAGAGWCRRSQRDPRPGRAGGSGRPRCGARATADGGQVKAGPRVAHTMGSSLSPHGLAVRTPAFHAGDRRFESGWGYSRIPVTTAFPMVAVALRGRGPAPMEAVVHGNARTCAGRVVSSERSCRSAVRAQTELCRVMPAYDESCHKSS